MKKILAAGLAAATALTLSVAPAASAQSLALSSSSSSRAFAPDPQHVKELEDAIAQEMTDSGYTRAPGHDKAAEGIMKGALEGKLNWSNSPVPGVSKNWYFDSTYMYFTNRMSHEVAKELRDNPAGLGRMETDHYVAYGLAVDSDDTWVYVVKSIQRT